MDNKQKFVSYLLAFILRFIGLIILIAYSWKIALAVLLIVWSDDVSRSVK